MAKKPAPKKAAHTLKSPAPVNRATGGPTQGTPPDIKSMPSGAPAVSNSLTFSEEGASMGQVQQVPNGGLQGAPDITVPLENADGSPQFVYVTSAPLIAAGNPRS